MNAGAPITGRAELDLADQYAALYWAAPRSFRLCLIALLLGTALVLAFEIASPQPNLTVIGLVASFVVSCFAVVAVGHWRSSAEQKRIEYRIDRERIVIRDGSGRAVATPWSAVTAIEERGPGLVLKQKSGGRWLVKRAFTPEALAALRAMKSPKAIK